MFGNVVHIRLRLLDAYARDVEKVRVWYGIDQKSILHLDKYSKRTIIHSMRRKQIGVNRS
ncbi:MAG: hypothetical protein M1381_02120 [Deltaproteobacteria bacterium]|nr:hypothetical protein [Deltaproteobacteria bacterium]MCL5792063.1 hypothetical protein [Deltaproteobacteria bacterium]